MQDELTELLDTAIYKEIASEALYSAAQGKTDDPGTKTLLKELAAEEKGHQVRLKKLKDKEFSKQDWHREKVADLKISDYLTGAETLEGAGIQDTLIFAMKKEQGSVEFYSRMMGAIADEAAKRVCEGLVHDELKHKLRLEVFYDDLFFKGG